MQQSVQHSISELHYCVITWVESMKPGCRLLTRAPNTDQTGIYPVYLASILHSKLSCFYLKQDQAAWLSQTKPYKDIPAGPDWQSDRVGCRLLWDVRHWCPQMENSWRCWSRVSVILFTAVLMFWFCMFLSCFFYNSASVAQMWREVMSTMAVKLLGLYGGNSYAQNLLLILKLGIMFYLFHW